MSSKIASSVDLDHEDNIGSPPSWILDLPDELLCIVLEVVANMDPPRGNHIAPHPMQYEKPVQSLGFLRLSEVCTRLRALLLSMPGLWANIVFRIPIVPTILALARSQSMPLAVHIEMPHSYLLYGNQEREASDLMRKRLVELAIEHVARICSLSVHELPAMHHKQLLGGPLPQLEVLNLHYGRIMHPSDNLGTMYVDAPVLREASFTFPNLNFFHGFERGVTFKCPALQSLKVSIRALDSDDILTPRWIADILETSPLLRHLTLDIDTNSEPIKWSTLFNGRHVRLVHLQSLELRGTRAANMPDLYKCLGSPRPARCIMRFEPYYLPEDEEEETELEDDEGAIVETASAFNPLLQHSSHNGLLVKVDYIEDNRHELTLRLFPAMKDPRQHSDSYQPDSKNIVELTVRSILPYENLAYEQVADIFAEALKHNVVKQLIIDAPGHEVWPSAVESIVATCTAATELVVYHTKVYNDFDGDVPLPDTVELLPALDTMFFRPRPPYDIGPKVSYDDHWEELIAWLEARSDAGLRVHRLHIIGLFELPGADEEDEAEEKDRAMCARAAEFVDEFVDERTRLACS